jgi:glycosyltransferase involved in cell wall biosynthesis
LHAKAQAETKFFNFKKMKVAYLLGSLNRGGTETLTLDVFRKVATNGLELIGIYRKKGGNLEKEFQESGVPVFFLPFKKNIFSYYQQLLKIIQQNNIDILHAQQPLDALLAWLCMRGTHKKIILTIHGYDFNQSFWSKKMLQFILHHTDGNIFVSESQRKYYQQKYHLKPEKQKTVYNGISFDKLDTAKTDRTKKSTSSELLKLGSVGNFVSVRSQIVICRFLNLLKKENIAFDFVFVGAKSKSEPWLFDECYRYCEENDLLDSVHFLGSRSDVPEILSTLDAFIYSTDHDTFGIAVVEAMAMEIPVFVNDWEVMKEITHDGKFATLYKSRDENDLLKKILLFLQNRAIAICQAREAAAYVRENFSIENHIHQLKQVYETVDS